MSLTDLASIGSLVSGFAVTASIIYLAIQTHQAAKHTRAQIQQGAAARLIALVTGLIDKESCAVWIEANGAEPTPAAIRNRQFALTCTIGIAAMEDLYLQHRNGLADPEHFARECVTFRGLLTQPGFRGFWMESRAEIVSVAPKFCAFVDELATNEVTGYTNRV